MGWENGGGEGSRVRGISISVANRTVFRDGEDGVVEVGNEVTRKAGESVLEIDGDSNPS